MKALKDWFKSADEYCFGFGSPTTMGLIRLFGGFFLLINLLMIGVFWQDWFGEKGYVPSWMGAIYCNFRSPLPEMIRGILPEGIPRIDLIYGVTDSRITIPFYCLVTVAALFTCLGLFTRYSAFALAIGMVTLHHRDMPLLHGGDTVMRLVAIYLAVSPCGESCSLDRLIGLWRGKISHEPKQISVWSQRLIAYNVALIYFTTIWNKWDGPLWRNFTAVYYPERLAEFTRFPVPEFFKSLWIAKIASFGTVATEFSMATLVFFPPARRYVLAGGILMHSYIEYSMNIPLFSFIMITTYLAFFEGEEIEGWARRMGMRLRKFHVIVRLPKGTRLTPVASTFMTALDPFSLVAYLPGEEEGFSAEHLDGSAVPVSTAIRGRCIGGWGFLWVPGALNRILTKATEPVPVVIEETEVPVDGRKQRAEASYRRKRR